MPKVNITDSKGLVQQTGAGVYVESPVYQLPTSRGSVTTTAATYSLTAAQSGTTLYINKDDGCDVTLPSAAPGLRYTIVQQLDFSSDTITIATAATDELFSGHIVNYKEGTGIAIFKPDGTNDDTITLNGTTTGGVKGGGVIELVCVSGTDWHVSGLVQASGTVATPFS